MKVECADMKCDHEKAGEKGSALLKLLVIVGLVLIVDQATKLMILHGLPLYGEIDVVPGFFSIVHYQNPGGAFGILSGVENDFRHIFFVIVSIFALGLVCYFYWTTPRTHRLLSAGFALILGGAVGNLVDRFRLGQVVDFLDVYVGDHHWPAFNMADSAISIGVAIFALHLLFGKMPAEIIGKVERSKKIKKPEAGSQESEQ